MILCLKRRTGSASRDDRLQRQNLQDKKIKMHPAYPAGAPTLPILSFLYEQSLSSNSSYDRPDLLLSSGNKKSKRSGLTEEDIA